MHQQKLVILHLYWVFLVLVAEKSAAGPMPQNFEDEISRSVGSAEADTVGQYRSSMVSLQTGKKLAVFEFEGKNISAPLITKMTEEFRNTVRDLKIFEVQDNPIMTMYDKENSSRYLVA